MQSVSPSRNEQSHCGWVGGLEAAQNEKRLLLRLQGIRIKLTFVFSLILPSLVRAHLERPPP